MNFTTRSPRLREGLSRLSLRPVGPTPQRESTEVYKIRQDGQDLYDQPQTHTDVPGQISVVL